MIVSLRVKPSLLGPSFEVLIACAVSATPNVVNVRFFRGREDPELIVRIWIQHHGAVLVYLGAIQQINSQICFFYLFKFCCNI